MDVLSIYNMALGSIGARAKLASVNDNLREAEMCNLHYRISRDAVFNAAYWPSLTATKRLSLLSEYVSGTTWNDSMPDPKWRFAYNIPTDFHRPRYLYGYGRFEMGVIGDARVVLTNTENAILSYTRRVDSPDEWETGLQMLVPAQLATALAMPITAKPDVYRLVVDIARSTYNEAVTAQANDGQFMLPDVVPEWIAARGGVATHERNGENRFYYMPQVLTYGLY